MDERRKRLKEIFAEAVDLSDDERSAFVDASCGDDAAMRQDVLDLLDAAGAPASVLAENAVNVAAMLDADIPTDRVFGKYKIVREIGHGGMGSVFLAERTDGEYTQEVALKVVRQTIADSLIVERFRRERQIMADLHHPNIAMLIDGGISERGEPFIAMEYIDGLDLREYCRQNALSQKQKLVLFLKICHAVAFAHRNLVIHRDIKPSNIIVTASGEPKLLDFGLAKLINEATKDEETKLRAFTLAYASPEQIRGKNITTASDVYSLGCVLFELLTGEKPFRVDHETPGSELLSRIDESGQIFRRLRTDSSAGVDADLATIISTAVRNEPERRYNSVASMIDDIERFLDHRPISARPNTFGYLAASFVRRNKIAVAATAVILVSILTGAAFAVWQANIARKQRDRAEKRFAEVRQLSNALLNEIAPKIERLPGALEAREALVNQSLKYLDSLATESSGDLQLQSELAAAYEKIGDLQGNPTNPNFIDLDAAINSYQKANQIRRGILEKNADDAVAREALAENYRVLGNIYGQANESENSTSNTQAALQIYRSLADGSGSSADLRLSLAKANYDSGLNMQTSKQYDASLPFFATAKSLLQEINTASPDRLEIVRSLGEVEAQNANSLSWAEKQPEANAEIRAAIANQEPLLANNPNDVTVRGSMWLVYWLACKIYQDQDDELAYQYGQKALTVVKNTVAIDPTNIRAKQQLAKSFSTLGECAMTLKRSSEALQYLEKASQMQREIIDGTTKNLRLRSELALSLTRLGSAEAGLGLVPEALKTLAESERSYQEIMRIAPDDRRSNRNLASTYQEIGKTNEIAFQKQKTQGFRLAALKSYQKALAILEQLAEKDMLAEADGKFLASIQAAVKRNE